MIDVALARLAGHLNQQLRERFQVNEDLVVLTDAHEPDGGLAALAANRLVLFVARIAPDTAGGVELSLVCAAMFAASNYAEGLKLLSAAMACIAALPADAGAEIVDLPAAEWHELWRVHGGQYLPSLMYRVRVPAAG